MMDLRKLSYLVTLAEELHFGNAARRHFISPQPFGQHIRDLERELGAQVFLRTSRRVELTDRGRYIVDHARVVLRESDRLRDLAAADWGPVLETDAVVRIGVFGFGLGDLWPMFRQLVQAQRPGLDLEYLELDFADEYDAIRTGAVDVGIVQDPGPVAGLTLEPALASPRVVVVPTSSAYAEADSLSLTSISESSWLRVDTHEKAVRTWLGFEVDSRMPAVRSPAAIPTAVATTGRVSLHAEAASAYYPRPDVRFVPMDGAPVTVAVACREGDARHSIQALVAAARVVRSVSEKPRDPDDALTKDRNLFG